MTAPTIQVSITYQRAVRVGAEQALLRDILNDVARLRADTRFGNAYRAVYGDKSKFNVEDLKKSLQAGDTVLVSEGEPATWETINKRAITPANLAELLNSAAETGKIPKSAKPVDAQGRPRDFEAADVLLDEKGQWPSIDPKAPRTAQEWVQNKAVLGSTPVQMSPDDLAKISAIQSDAAALGVSANDLLYYYNLSVSDETLAKSSKVSVWWQGTDIADSTKLLSGTRDILRDTAPRPGGVNNLADPTRELFTDPETEQFFSESERAALRPSGNPEFEMSHFPDANIQKEDNYAVLRVVSGFTPAAGDLLAPAVTKGKFDVLFATNRFLLESVQESQAERISMVETFGETILYSFGERPKVYAYSGTLMDTQGLNWLNEWREAYKTKFRASAMLKLKARAFLIYRDVCREGIIIANVNTLNVAEMGLGRFSFQMFVMREYFVGRRPAIGDQTNFNSGLEQPEPQDPEETQYVLGSMTDTTDAPANTVGAAGSPLASRMRAAIAGEAKIVDRHRSEIEGKIRGQAFPGGKYKQSSGFFDIDLESGDATSAAYSYNTRVAQEDWNAGHPDKLVEVK